MTLEETTKILAVICEAYPLFLKDRNPETTAMLWQRLFADEPYDLVETGLMAFISTDTKGFPPSIGAIKEMIGQVATKDELTAFEAWGLVMKAASNSIYNSDAEYAKLPRSIQEVVGSPNQLREWAMMDAEEVQTVIGSHFQRSYTARCEARKKYGMLPSALRAKLGDGKPAEEEPYIATDKPMQIGDVYKKLLGMTEANKHEDYQDQRP